MARYGELYRDLKLMQLSALLYYPWFLLRRYIFVTLIFTMNDSPIQAIMINFFLTFGNMIYLLKVRPFKDGNKTLIFNEMCLLLSFYHLILLTDYVDDISMRENVGW